MSWVFPVSIDPSRSIDPCCLFINKLSCCSINYIDPCSLIKVAQACGLQITTDPTRNCWKNAQKSKAVFEHIVRFPPFRGTLDDVNPMLAAHRITSRIVSPPLQAATCSRPVQVLRQFREPRCLLLPDDDSRCRGVRLGSSSEPKARQRAASGNGPARI